MSTKFTLTPSDIEKWTNNAVTFLAPLGVINFGAIALTLQAPGHVFSVNDFVPSTFTLGAMALYIVNTMFDISKKLFAPK